MEFDRFNNTTKINLSATEQVSQWDGDILEIFVRYNQYLSCYTVRMRNTSMTEAKNTAGK